MMTSPLPPRDMVMPDAEYTITVLWAGLAMLAIIHALWISYRTKKILPLVLIGGAALAMGSEALVINYMHCWYPAVGQINAYHAFNQSIPLFVCLAYVFFFAPGIIMLMSKLDKGATVKDFWLVYAGAMVGVVLYETVGLSLGLWTYYGTRPLLIGGLPAYCIFLNSSLIVFPAAILHKAKDHIFGWRNLLVLPSVAGMVAGLEMFLGYPVYFAKNAGVSLAAANVAAIISICFVLGLLWACARIVCITEGKAEAVN